MKMDPEEMIRKARWMAECEPECSLCGTMENLFQLGSCTVCKSCLPELIFDNLEDAELCEALRLYVDSDPNAEDWFGEYFEQSRLPETWF